MPSRSDRFDEAYAAAEEGELPYISKSRVVQWVKNPEHFRLKYLEGLKQPPTDPMRRGTRIHESIEQYYYKLPTHMPVALDDPAVLLPDDRGLWADFIEPYISNFFLWEKERFQHAVKTVGYEDAGRVWAPVAVEDEHWRQVSDWPELCGLADVVHNAEAMPGTEYDEGEVIVDFKTGKVPDPKYRDEGIHLELAFYYMLFGGKYDVTACAAYYPKEHETIVVEREQLPTGRVTAAVTDMLNAVRDYDGEGHFETKEGPLCKWGLDSDQESPYYGICPCTWGVPAHNPETFKELVNDGKGMNEIARLMGTTPNAVGYWKYKMDL